jgi:ketosteroid isomerase-like protein
MTAERLQAFVTASEQADIDAIMSFIHDDCLYITTTGSAPGTEFRGKEPIRAIFLEILADTESEVTYGPLYVSGNRGTVEWQVRTPQADGSATLIRGVDLFTFENDLIVRKDAFRKVVV